MGKLCLTGQKIALLRFVNTVAAQDQTVRVEGLGEFQKKPNIFAR